MTRAERKQVYSNLSNLRVRNKLVLDARNQGAWMRFRGQSVLREPWKRRVGDPEGLEQVNRVGSLLTPWKPIRHTTRLREMAKEGVQEDVKIASTKTYPPKDQTDHVPPRLDRSPSASSERCKRREERSRARLIFKDSQAVGRLPECLAMIFIEPLVSRGQLGELVYRLKRNGRERNSGGDVKLEGQQTLNRGGSNQVRLPFRGTVDVTVGGRGPNHPQDMSRRSTKSLGLIAMMLHELIRAAGYSATSHLLYVFLCIRLGVMADGGSEWSLPNPDLERLRSPGCPSFRTPTRCRSPKTQTSPFLTKCLRRLQIPWPKPHPTRRPEDPQAGLTT
uniref:Uncharacterized protein n=1 Tax=Hyaloperonospora arabidopsidis (strain Emoy2) TaxID=559515 RepID=M4B2P3_HYAAE